MLFDLNYPSVSLFRLRFPLYSMYYVSSSALLPALYTVCVEYITPTLELLQNMKYEAKHTFLNMTFSLIFVLRVFFFFSKPVVSIAIQSNIFTCSRVYMMSNKNLGNVRFFIEPSRILSDIQKPVTKGPGGRHEWWYSGFFIECVCDQWLYTAL